jgi:hypothetical protein
VCAASGRENEVRSRNLHTQFVTQAGGAGRFLGVGARWSGDGSM